jgi:hypothetical protein
MVEVHGSLANRGRRPALGSLSGCHACREEEEDQRLLHCSLRCLAPHEGATKEDYYANVVPRTVPLVFNLRMDPYESYDNKDSYGHLLQKVSWLIQPMGRLMGAHLKSLVDHPPVQGGKSFDMSNVVEEFIKKGRQ